MKDRTRKHLREQLLDPDVPEYDKVEIRRRLEIYPQLTVADFEDMQESIIKRVGDYIESHYTRVYINNIKDDQFVELESVLDTTHVLCLFYVSLTEGVFVDRTISVPKMEYNIGYFYKYKKSLIDGLKSVGLVSEAKIMDQELVAVEVLPEQKSKLEDVFWNISFKAKLWPLLVKFIRSNKVQLLQLQELGL